MNVLIPMAGAGRRFLAEGYKDAKPLIPVLGKPMIQQAVDTLGLICNYIFCVSKEHVDGYQIDEVLKKLYPTCRVIVVDRITDGCSETCLLAKDYINNDEELLITNCDQYMEWDAAAFVKFLADHSELDGVLVTYPSTKKINSYARLGEDGFVDLVREKEVISNHSLNGIHYWRKGKYFVDSAEKQIETNDRTNNEFYLAPTYNHMIADGLKVGIYPIPAEQHNAIGCPEDLQIFLRKNPPFKVQNIEDMKGGWFVGDFEPCAVRTAEAEVGYKVHKRGEQWPKHYHAKAIEVTYLVKGRMMIQGMVLESGDVFTLMPNQIADPEFFEDCEVIVVKIPSVIGDKYEVE